VAQFLPGGLIYEITSALGRKDINRVARGLQQVEGLLTIKILLFVAILIA